MQITKNQQHVLNRMHDGWQLGHSMAADCHWHLYCGGYGSGGEVERVMMSTAHALVKQKLIRCATRRFPLAMYEVTTLAESEVK